MARHRDHQPRDPRHRLAGAGRPGAGVAGRARRHRDPHRLLRPRPRPADPGRVAGERQAPSHQAVRPVPGEPPRRAAQRRGRAVVLGRPGGAGRAGPLGASRSPATGCTSSPCRRPARARPCCGSGSPACSGSTPRSSRPRTRPTPRSAYRSRRWSAGSTSGSTTYCPTITTGPSSASCWCTGTSRGRPGSPRLSLPEDAYRWASDLGRSWVSELALRGYDVVGDLDDLVPGPALPFTDPDDCDEHAGRRGSDRRARDHDQRDCAAA